MKYYLIQKFKIFLHEKKNNKKFIITYSGNLGKGQSIDCLINAVSRIKDKNFILNIFGDGSEKEKLLKLIKKKNYKKKIIYFKPLPFKKLKKYLFLQMQQFYF